MINDNYVMDVTSNRMDLKYSLDMDGSIHEFNLMDDFIKTFYKSFSEKTDRDLDPELLNRAQNEK